MVEISRSLEGNRAGGLAAGDFQDMLQHMVVQQPLANHVETQSATASAAPPLFAGFDMQRLPWDQTAKYQFARAASRFSLAGVHDGTSAQALLETMRPTLEAQGLPVLDIQNNRLKIMQEGHEQWIEVIQGAANGTPAFDWRMR
jgi:hypothetical protein